MGNGKTPKVEIKFLEAAVLFLVLEKQKWAVVTCKNVLGVFRGGGAIRE